jgi:hypothetical protein
VRELWSGRALDPRLLDERGLIAYEDVLDLLNVGHFGYRAALSDITITLVFGKPFSQMCNLQVPVSYFPNLSLRQSGRSTVPSQFHNASYL